MLDRFPVGNIMTTFGILMSLSNMSQAMLMFRHIYWHSIAIYHNLEREFLFFIYFETLASLQIWFDWVNKNKEHESHTLSEDGCLDSMVTMQKWCFHNV